MWRVVAKPHKPKGLLIAWMFGEGVDNALRLALPGWAIVTRSDRQLSVTSSDLDQARRLAGCDASVPRFLAGWSAGCQGVRSALLAGLDVAGVAVFDGTGATVPEPLPWQIKVWADAAAKARAGKLVFVATCTSMTYTERLPPGPPPNGPYMASRHVLERALNTTLEIGAPICEGLLHVERFDSPTGADEESAQAHRDQVNKHMPRLLAEHFATWEPPVYVKPALTLDLTQAILDAAKADLNACAKEWSHNAGPEIERLYLTPLGLEPGSNYCAAAGTAWKIAGEKASGRTSVIEGGPGAQAMMSQAKKAKLWTPKGPKLAASLRPGHWLVADRSVPGKPKTSWQGHWMMVCDVVNQSAFTIEANADRIVAPDGRIYAVCMVERKLDDPRLFGAGRWE